MSVILPGFPALRTIPRPACAARGGLALESALFAKALWLFLAGTIAGGIAVGLIFRGGLSELDRLAEPRHRAAVMSTFFAAAYLGLGLPAVLTGLISQLAGTVDASVWTSGFVAAIVLAAFAVVQRTYGTAPAPQAPSTPSDGWCSPQEPASAGTGQRNRLGVGLRAVTPRPRHQGGSR